MTILGTKTPYLDVSLTDSQNHLDHHVPLLMDLKYVSILSLARIVREIVSLFSLGKNDSKVHEWPFGTSYILGRALATQNILWCRLMSPVNVLA